jgi:riboflavin synthase
MFTGIVQQSVTVEHIDRKPGLHTLKLALPDYLREELQIGGSVAVDGVCLTATEISAEFVGFDVMQETLSLTCLGGLCEGDRVNVERSAKQGVEVGGHIISGHVDGCVEITRIEAPENNLFVRYRVDGEKLKYVFKKGFIGLNGCSLTVADVHKASNEFTVCFIPETLRVTTHGEKNVGSRINVEIDRQTQAIVDTVERFLHEHPEQLRSQHSETR